MHYNEFYRRGIHFINTIRNVLKNRSEIPCSAQTPAKFFLTPKTQRFSPILPEYHKQGIHPYRCKATPTPRAVEKPVPFQQTMGHGTLHKLLFASLDPLYVFRVKPPTRLSGAAVLVIKTAVRQQSRELILREHLVRSRVLQLFGSGKTKSWKS